MGLIRGAVLVLYVGGLFILVLLQFASGETVVVLVWSGNLFKMAA